MVFDHVLDAGHDVRSYRRSGRCLRDRRAEASIAKKTAPVRRTARRTSDSVSVTARRSAALNLRQARDD
jgi:hypothetical protein